MDRKTGKQITQSPNPNHPVRHADGLPPPVDPPLAKTFHAFFNYVFSGQN